MALCVGIDVSKEKFDACGIEEEGGEKVFSVSCPMDRSGFDRFILQLPADKTTFVIGMESTACYHMPLFSYLTAQDYPVVIINPLLIKNFAKRSLRKTKTDKKDALTIAQFLMREKESLSMDRPSHLISELRDLARRREKLADQVTSLKSDMKRILSVTFPELKRVTGVFTKSTLRLLAEFPSAHALKKASPAAVAGIVISRSRGRKSQASVHALIAAASFVSMRVMSMKTTASPVMIFSILSSRCPCGTPPRPSLLGTPFRHSLSPDLVFFIFPVHRSLLTQYLFL